MYSHNTKWFQLQNQESGLTVNTPGDDLSVAFGGPRLDQHHTPHPVYTGLLLIFKRAPFIIFAVSN